jgi:hypothetical protein
MILSVNLQTVYNNNISNVKNNNIMGNLMTILKSKKGSKSHELDNNLTDETSNGNSINLIKLFIFRNNQQIFIFLSFIAGLLYVSGYNF